ncbi:hypothetical protein [Thermococcus chitonophagus]|uniref:hypothetical protein n=1 Tax=Thermococcus chitonophagus TaxID=54262 RepID=UPI0012ED52E3|nr:hypothetical protein [Thermococcus chitonophagus]
MYRFAEIHGVNMTEFFRNLSEYVWETKEEITYEKARELLIRFAKERGIDLEEIAREEGVDLDFMNVNDIVKVLGKGRLKEMLSKGMIAYEKERNQTNDQ